MLVGRKVLLGVSGSIAAYKACDLIQRLKNEGAEVQVIMTASATHLVHPNTFGALTGKKVFVSGWEGVEAGAMPHIDLARWADVFLIAPCTAHTLGEFTHGLTGSLVSLVYLAYGKKAFIAPAMNTVMLRSSTVQENLIRLRDKGDIILPSGEGVLACGEEGEGKLLDVQNLVNYLKSQLAAKGPYPELRNRKVLLALGRTEEKIDDVRFLSNRSSGRTGLALARAFQLAGAFVELVAGHIDEDVPPGMVYHPVSSSADFHREVTRLKTGADIVVMAAAIADFVPAKTWEGKLKKSKSMQSIDLKPSVDILHELGSTKSKGQILVGFALETDDWVKNAFAKLQEKLCDLIVVNNPIPNPSNDSIAGDSGFGKDSVRACVLGKNTIPPLELPLITKDSLADDVLAGIHELLPRLEGM